MDGLSPRVRGHRRRGTRVLPALRSIPACAGSSFFSLNRQNPWTVYPRVCGVIATAERVVAYIYGLSPRVRGHRVPVAALVRVLGSIPACAGSSFSSAHRSTSPSVYPRVCGVIACMSRSSNKIMGLSPRVRGHHHGGAGRRGEPRSIPACAGSSHKKTSLLRRCTVYPRVCGVIPLTSSGRCTIFGLSPRVRGHRVYRYGFVRRARSIPACAGSSHHPITHKRRTSVYPRVCGVIRRRFFLGSLAQGLSPRVRGHRVQAGARVVTERSIPACAGSSQPREKVGASFEVYPRVCGVIARRQGKTPSCRGLSPRVRGHRFCEPVHDGGRRSIPACAGSSQRQACGGFGGRVYPRVCGVILP